MIASSAEVALAWAQQQFHDCLLTAPEASGAREFLAGRGYSAKTIADFKLGFHPDTWTWLMDQVGERFTLQQLVEAGLISRRATGSGYFSILKNRLVFPIHDLRGCPIAFSGRALPSHRPPQSAEFLLTPSSEFFQARETLYALHTASSSIRELQVAVVVETVSACVTCHQHGARNVVASLWSLTEQHVEQLSRLASLIVVVFDGDDGAHAAARRTVSRIPSVQVDVRVAVLPDGKDPAGIITASGVEEFQRIVEQSTDWR